MIQTPVIIKSTIKKVIKSVELVDKYIDRQMVQNISKEINANNFKNFCICCLSK